MSPYPQARSTRALAWAVAATFFLSGPSAAWAEEGPAASERLEHPSSDATPDDPAPLSHPLHGDAAAGCDLGASERRPFSEPLGPFPAPWAALSAALDGGSRVDGTSGWTALRVHVPVVNRYGAVDARLELGFDPEGLVGIEPEILFRVIPLQLVERRATLGLALGLVPGMDGPDPLIELVGGLMGGYLGRTWMARAYVGVRGEVLELETPLRLETSLAAGLRLPYGFRPLLEVDLLWDVDTDDVFLAFRPGLRYWPADWIGLGLSADLWAATPEGFWAALRLDVVLHARE